MRINELEFINFQNALYFKAEKCLSKETISPEDLELIKIAVDHFKFVFSLSCRLPLTSQQ